MKKGSILSYTIAIIFIFLCVGTLASIRFVMEVPARAEREFGPPEPSLDWFERISLSVKLLSQADKLNQPGSGNGESEIFLIELGESTYSITNRLEHEGLVPDAAAMRTYLVYSGLDKSVQAGEFSLNPLLSTIGIAQTLQDSTPTHVTFRILAGWRMDEIAAALPTSGLNFSPEDFLAHTRQHPSQFDAEISSPPGASMEGFLFPDSYRLERSITVQDLMRIVLDDFKAKVNQEIQDGIQRQGLDLYQAVTLASIIEREAIVDEEMPLIASVFLNRIAAGMKLDSDPTVQYALGFQPATDSNFTEKKGSWWKNPLSLLDLEVDSTYNTYRYAGLPPGPISNPSLAAIRAVAFPAQSPYYYFRAACDGSGKHLFAETFEQHKANACQ